MTVYEFFIQSAEHGIRLEVPVQGLSHAIDLFRRLDDHAAAGHGRVVVHEPGRARVADLIHDDARYLLEGIEQVYVGTAGQPERGRLVGSEEALAELPVDATLVASYYEV